MYITANKAGKGQAGRTRNRLRSGIGRQTQEWRLERCNTGLYIRWSGKWSGERGLVYLGMKGEQVCWWVRGFWEWREHTEGHNRAGGEGIAGIWNDKKCVKMTQQRIYIRIYKPNHVLTFVCISLPAGAILGEDLPYWPLFSPDWCGWCWGRKQKS